MIKSFLEIFIADHFSEYTSLLNQSLLIRALQSIIPELDQLLFASFNEIREETENILAGLSFVSSFDENRGLEEFGQPLEFF